MHRRTRLLVFRTRFGPSRRSDGRLAGLFRGALQASGETRGEGDRLVREQLRSVFRHLRRTAVLVELPAADHRLGAGFAERQAQAVSVVLDAHNLQRHDVAFLHDLLGVADATVHQLGDVDETLDRPREPSERAERDELCDHTGDDIAHLVTRDQLLPLLRCSATDRERDLLRVLIDAHDEDVDFVADLEQVFRLRVAVPRQLGQVDEAIGAAKVNEHTEVPDGGDAAEADFSLVQFVEETILLLRAPLLQRGTL